VSGPLVALCVAVFAVGVLLLVWHLRQHCPGRAIPILTEGEGFGFRDGHQRSGGLITTLTATPTRGRSLHGSVRGDGERASCSWSLGYQLRYGDGTAPEHRAPILCCGKGAPIRQTWRLSHRYKATGRYVSRRPSMSTATATTHGDGCGERELNGTCTQRRITATRSRAVVADEVAACLDGTLKLERRPRALKLHAHGGPSTQKLSAKLSRSHVGSATGSWSVPAQSLCWIDKCRISPSQMRHIGVARTPGPVWMLPNQPRIRRGQLKQREHVMRVLHFGVSTASPAKRACRRASSKLAGLLDGSLRCPAGMRPSQVASAEASRSPRWNHPLLTVAVHGDPRPTVPASSADAIGPDLGGSGEKGGLDPKNLRERTGVSRNGRVEPKL